MPKRGIENRRQPEAIGLQQAPGAVNDNLKKIIFKNISKSICVYKY